MVAGRCAADVDADIAARVKGGAAALRFYDGVSHGGIFGLSKPIRASLAAETRIITIANPVFMYRRRRAQSARARSPPPPPRSHALRGVSIRSWRGRSR